MRGRGSRWFLLSVVVPLACLSRQAAQSDEAGATSGDQGTDDRSASETSTGLDGTESESTAADPCRRDPYGAPEGGLGSWGFGLSDHPEVIGRWFHLPDFNGDGLNDVLAAGYEERQVFLQDCRGQLSAGASVSFPVRIEGVEVGDFDGDGDVDVVVFGSGFEDRLDLMRETGDPARGASSDGSWGASSGPLSGRRPDVFDDHVTDVSGMRPACASLLVWDAASSVARTPRGSLRAVIRTTTCGARLDRRWCAA